MSSPGSRETRAFASEIKFLVPRSLGAGIREWARHHMSRDLHGSGQHGDEYRITTIYFDSPGYDVYNRRGSFGRSKYRIRRYDECAEVFLERKLRQPPILAKRRTLVPASWLPRLQHADAAEWSGSWFHRRLQLRRLLPVCEISYFRTARLGDTPSGPIRLTLDEGLHAMRRDVPAFEPAGAGVDLLQAETILELKYRTEVPALFKRLVEEFGLRPQTASKYRIGIAAIDPGCLSRDSATDVQQDAVGGVPCA